MIRKLLVASLALLVVGAALITSASRFREPRSFDPQPIQLPQQSMPVDGWSVCQVGGIETIPGAGSRQTFVLCHGQGWQLKTYCLQPGAPAPALGKACSYVGNRTYWCGDAVQQLLSYQVLQTPAPVTPTTPTRTPTATRVSTSTPTRATPLLETVAFPTATRTPRPRSTAYARPHPGGPGNLGSILAESGLVGALVLAGGATVWLLLRRRTR